MALPSVISCGQPLEFNHPVQYQLIPVQPWTWLAKVPADNAAPPLCVEWDPAALPPDDESPTFYWTWDGRTVGLCEWYMGHWKDINSLGMDGLVLAWQPLCAPSAPSFRKDPA